MPDIAQWPTIAVMGAGAVGCYFGGMLARAGAPVTFIGRPTHVEAMRMNGLLLESSRFRESLPVRATTDVSAVRDAPIVLLSVKTPNTEEASRSLLPHLVDNIERIRAAGPIDAIAAVVYVGAEMAAPGHVKHTARGDLILGDFPRGNPRDDVRRRYLEQLAALFVRAEVPCRISDNVEADLWTKLIMNCAYNAISALSRARYGRIVRNSFTHDLMRRAVEEVIAVGRAAGVQMADDLVAAAWKLAESMPGALSSTAQDIGRGKRTEIDALNGYVARRGAELGIATPVNQTLHALVKLLEEAE